jgi:HEAT repeat protein
MHPFMTTLGAIRYTSSTRPLLAGFLLSACTAALAAPAPTAAPDPVKPLIAILQSGASSQKEKADACRELARVGTKEAVAPLAALLPNYSLSHMARYGLETIPDPSVDKALRDAARKLHGRPLVGVIGSIGVRRDPNAVGLLAEKLQSLNPEVAQASARALGKIGNKDAARAIEAALPNAPEADQAVFCEGLICCAEALAAKSDLKQAIAIYDLVLDRDVPHQVRTAALRGAILTRQKDGLPLLLQSMREGDFAVFAACARISQEMPGAQVTLALAGELNTPLTNRLTLLIQTLAYRHDAAAMPALLAIAKDGKIPARLAAIRAIPQIGDPSALPVLLELVCAPDKEISAAAQESLAALQGKQVDDAIMTMLSDTNAASRLMAMDLIARRRMTSATPALLAATESPDQKTHTSAVKKLGELGGPAELPALLDLLAKAKDAEDLEATEQAVSALCLKSADSADCVATLDSRMAAAQPAQKCALVRVLAAVGGTNALKGMRAAVKDPNADVHAAAIRALGGWTSADAAPDLLEQAKAAANPTEKMICLRGYLRLAGQADLPVSQRLAMCRQAGALAQKDDEKKLLLAALGTLPSIEALDLITPYLDEDGTKEEAATAAVDVSEKLLKEKDAAKLATRLAEALDKVASATANADLSKRAKDLRDKANIKAASK